MLIAGSALIAGIVAAAPPINLAKLLADGKLRAVNREVTKVPDKPEGVHMTEAHGSGIVWIEGSDFAQGTIEVDIRGRDVFQQSFVGVAFHGKDDKTYEGVYLRPFNFRAQDPVRHKHAVQYISMPEHDWPVLREKFPDEFERAVDPSIGPTDWVPPGSGAGEKHRCLLRERCKADADRS
jgi:hypothetical protein